VPAPSIRELTNLAEKGDGCVFSEQLGLVPGGITERLQVLNQIKQMNEQDRQINKNLPELSVSFNAGALKWDGYYYMQLELDSNNHSWFAKFNNSHALYYESQQIRFGDLEVTTSTHCRQVSDSK